MKLKRKISVFFVQLAMALFLAHSLVPHCHGQDGMVAVSFNHYNSVECEAESCRHHHCADYHGETHFCHNHQNHDLGEDCVLMKPFIQSSAEIFKLHAPSWYASEWVADCCQLDDFDPTIPMCYLRGSPLEVLQYNSVVLTSSGGLRAPPVC